MNDLTYINSALNNIKNRIVNIGLILSSGLSVIVYILSYWNIKASGLTISHIINLLIVLAIVIITLFRNRIDLRIKSLVIISVLFISFFIDLFHFGLLSANKVLIVLIPFFALIVFPLKRAIIIYGIAILGFIVIAAIIISGRNPMIFNLSFNLYQIESWAINLILLLIVASLIFIGFHKFNQTYISLLKDLEDRNLIIAQNEQNYREIFNSSADAIFIQDMEGKILEVNEAMLKTYEYTADEIKNIDISKLSAQKDGYNKESALKHVQEAIAKGKTKFDWQARKKSGQLFWVEVELKVTHLLGDKRLLAVVSDIDEKKWNAIQLEKYKTHLEELVQERTKQVEAANEELLATNEELLAQSEELQITLDELKQTQEKLIHSEKMASLGVLSAGVAHEINNPLNFIQGGLTGIEEYLSEHKLSDNNDIKVMLDAMNEGVERASTIVTSLNHFSHQGESKTEVCSVESIIDNCLVILHNSLKEKIKLIKDYQTSDIKIQCNDGKLHQAFLNLINNAEQAIMEKGTIKISTRSEVNSLQIIIKDNGCGISNDLISRITEPFFTTKAPGNGTGLGLSITYNIIKEHDGNLEFNSEEGAGTTVLVTLPIE